MRSLVVAGLTLWLAAAAGRAAADVEICGMRLTHAAGVEVASTGRVPVLRVTQVPTVFWLDNRGSDRERTCAFEIQGGAVGPDGVFFMRGGFDLARSEVVATPRGRVRVATEVMADSFTRVCIDPPVEVLPDPYRVERGSVIHEVQEGAFLRWEGEELIARSHGPATLLRVTNSGAEASSVSVVLENVSERLSDVEVSYGGTSSITWTRQDPLQLRVVGTLAAGATATLVLRSRPLPDPYTFAFGGDVKKRLDLYVELLDEVAARGDPLFMLAVGDYTNDSLCSEVEAFLEGTRDLPFPVYYVKGNHEVHCQGDSHYRRHFGVERYHFAVGDLLFVVVDANGWTLDGFRIGAEQLSWLEGVLADHGEGRRTLVALHASPHPHHGRGLIDYPGNLHAEDAARLLSIAAAHGVDYVLSGHTHLYARKEEGGTVFLTSGGGGAALDRYEAQPGFTYHLEPHLMLMQVSADAITEERLTLPAAADAAP